LAQALAHHQAGRLAEAEEGYRRILAVTPNEPRALQLPGTIALQTGYLGEAETLLRAAISHAPQSAEAYSNLGLVMAATTRIDDAVGLFRHAIALHPLYAEAHHNLGLALEHKGETDAALASYARAVEIKPDYADALCNLAMALHVRRRPAEAVKLYRRALVASPGLARLWVYLAAALAECDDDAGARMALEEARTRTPDDPLVDLCRTMLAVRAGDAEGEMELLRQRGRVARQLRGQPPDPIETSLREMMTAGTLFIATAKVARDARKAATVSPDHQVTDRVDLKLTAYALHPEAPPLIVASTTRDWMDLTPGRVAYRCLPMVIANQAGWLVLNANTFAATWDGSNGSSGVHVECLGDAKPFLAYSHFGSGVLTWDVPYLFRTPPGYNLLVRGPANHPKDGVCALEGLVETDWNEATFTMNWKLTRPGHRIVFGAGEPFAMLVPQKRGELERVRPDIRDISTDPSLELNYRKWSALRDTFQHQRDDPASPANSAGWQRHYMLGLSVTTKPAPEHQTGLALRAFEDKRP